MPKTVTSTDDGLQIFAARDLDSNVLARIPKDVEVELGDTSIVEGREWFQATLKDGTSGFVLAPSARGRTSLASERSALAGIADNERKQKPMEAPQPSPSEELGLNELTRKARRSVGIPGVLWGVLNALMFSLIYPNVRTIHVVVMLQSLLLFVASLWCLFSPGPLALIVIGVVALGFLVGGAFDAPSPISESGAFIGYLFFLALVLWWAVYAFLLASRLRSFRRRADGDQLLRGGVPNV
jgi:hypothetical protein